MGVRTSSYFGEQQLSGNENTTELFAVVVARRSVVVVVFASPSLVGFVIM
jgi:hypothetical protein